MPAPPLDSHIFDPPYNELGVGNDNAFMPYQNMSFTPEDHPPQLDPTDLHALQALQRLIDMQNAVQPAPDAGGQDIYIDEDAHYLERDGMVSPAGKDNYVDAGISIIDSGLSGVSMYGNVYPGFLDQPADYPQPSYPDDEIIDVDSWQEQPAAQFLPHFSVPGLAEQALHNIHDEAQTNTADREFHLPEGQPDYALPDTLESTLQVTPVEGPSFIDAGSSTFKEDRGEEAPTGVTLESGGATAFPMAGMVEEDMSLEGARQPDPTDERVDVIDPALSAGDWSSTVPIQEASSASVVDDQLFVPPPTEAGTDLSATSSDPINSSFDVPHDALSDTAAPDIQEVDPDPADNVPQSMDSTTAEDMAQVPSTSEEVAADVTVLAEEPVPTMTVDEAEEIPETAVVALDSSVEPPADTGSTPIPSADDTYEATHTSPAEREDIRDSPEQEVGPLSPDILSNSPEPTQFAHLASSHDTPKAFESAREEGGAWLTLPQEPVEMMDLTTPATGDLDLQGDHDMEDAEKSLAPEEVAQPTDDGIEVEAPHLNRNLEGLTPPPLDIGVTEEQAIDQELPVLPAVDPTPSVLTAESPSNEPSLDSAEIPDANIDPPVEEPDDIESLPGHDEYLAAQMDRDGEPLLDEAASPAHSIEVRDDEDDDADGIDEALRAYESTEDGEELDSRGGPESPKMEGQDPFEDAEGYDFSLVSSTDQYVLIDFSASFPQPRA